MFTKRGIKLHIIISLLILFIIICTVAINWFISMNTQKKSLTDNYLNSNYNYAKKLTSSTEYQLNYMQKNIIAIGEFAGNSTFNQKDLDTWYAANKDQFNSMITTDQKGVVQLISPASIQYNRGVVVSKGTKLKTETIKKALIDKTPLISEPYRGTSGQLITLISAPIFDEHTREFKGVIGGTIYMESENVLKSILGTHEYDNSSYVYVVDRDGKLIYHPDAERLGEDVSSNEVVQQVMNKKSGSQTTTNKEGKEFFAGYSYVESTGWGIIAQTPTTVVGNSLNDLFWRMVMLSVPFLLIILLIGGVLVSTITKPLNRLADFSLNVMKEKCAYQDVELLNIHSPVYEVRQLYYQVIDNLRMLNKQAKMDGLTELANRRTFDEVIELWVKEGIPFSLIMLDIDHFKLVNDTHGHLVGDQVLKYLSNEMEEIFSKDDLCFRYGGEEFGVLVKKQGEYEAFELAEKLRTTIERSVSPTKGSITISLGVTACIHTDNHPKLILSRADTALYESKKTGRNKTTIFKVKAAQRA